MTVWTALQIVTLIDQLVDQHTDGDIATLLNARVVGALFDPEGCPNSDQSVSRWRNGSDRAAA